MLLAKNVSPWENLILYGQTKPTWNAWLQLWTYLPAIRDHVIMHKELQICLVETQTHTYTLFSLGLSKHSCMNSHATCNMNMQHMSGHVLQTTIAKNSNSEVLLWLKSRHYNIMRFHRFEAVLYTTESGKDAQIVLFQILDLCILYSQCNYYLPIIYALAA